MAPAAVVRAVPKLQVLARLFGNVQLHQGIHHFVAPQRIYTPAHIAELLALWGRAEERLA